MAASIQRLQDHFLSCIICTDLYKDPCTLACGHTFCRGCLLEFTKTQEAAIRSKSLLCPSCKQMSRVPNPSTTVENWVKQFKPSFLMQGLLDDFASRETVDTDAVDNPCFTCLQHGETSPASSYCTDCDIILCKKCIKTLHSVPVNANHVLSHLEGEVKVMKKRKVICKAHNSIVEFCCKDCHKAVCQKCCILDHRKCDNVVTIESMMPEMKSLLKENRDELSQQIDRTESCMKTMKTNITEIEGRKVQTLAEIEKVTQTAINLIRRKEKQLIDELEDITGKQVGEMRGQLKSGEIDIQMYQQHREFIDHVLKAENEMDMYDMYQMCQSGAITTVSETDTQLIYTSPMDEIIFVKHFDQSAFNNNIQIGNLRVVKKEFDPKCTPTLVDTIDIRTKRDKKAPDPVDVTVLDVAGMQTLLVTDYYNKNLKSFYTRDQQSCDSSLQLDRRPWSVTRVTDNQVAVSYESHNQITLVKVTPDLVLLSNMTTQRKYTGLTVLKATTIVAGCDDPPSLDILDLTGRVQRSITIDRRLIPTPNFLSTTNKGNILMSDGGSQSVICLTPAGDVIFTYSLSGNEIKSWSRGVTTSTTGDILVADYDNNKVIQLTPTGDFVRDLLTSQDDIDCPYGICLHSGKLYVAVSRKHIKVFSVN